MNISNETAVMLEKVLYSSALLKSSVEGYDLICHPTSNEYAPILPRCAPTIIIESSKDHHDDGLTHDEVILFIFCSLLCIVCSSLAAALTIGVLSINPFDLLIQIRTAKDEKEKKQAASLVPILNHRYQHMVTLLIIKNIANEALPVFLDELVHAAVAIILSVTCVLLFCDVLPNAIFSGPNKIALSSKFVWVMKILRIIFFPVAYPIAALLNKILGHSDNSYDRNQLAAFVRINYEERNKHKEEHTTVAAAAEEDLGMRSIASISYNEVLLMEGALQFKTKKVRSVMKELDQVFSLSDDTQLTQDEMRRIHLTGFSRIPVYTNIGLQQRQYKGILLTKQLMIVSHAEESQTKKLSSMPLQRPVCVSLDTNLSTLLKLFLEQKGAFKGGHMALVCEDAKRANEILLEQGNGAGASGVEDVIGIITLEDVIEELLQNGVNSVEEGSKSSSDGVV